MGKVGELKDVEDDSKTDRFQGVNAAQGNAVEDLLEQDMIIHGVSLGRGMKKGEAKKIAPPLANALLEIFLIVFERDRLDLVSLKLENRHL